MNGHAGDGHAGDKVKAIPTWYVDPSAENAMGDGHAPIWRHLIGLIPERDLSAKTVLDFGCNQGGFLRHLHALRPFRRALGLDIAERSIATANSLKGNLPIQYQTGADVSGWTETFDLAFSHEVVYLIPDIDAHARDIRQALKTDGIYYAVTGCHTDNPLWPKWRSLVAERTNTVVQDRSVSDYAKAFAAAGFTVSARKILYDGFIPYAPDGWTPDFMDALDYYSQTKIVFRLVKH
ncbi:class I SAM-dependent methyltransferase [Segnochrobactrum spirostomi]|uniref:Class I SAM-dependent methyltransferase n=1 Tax=Segnochrobactrum spirostomi TaxID=2608987 RepID=A0A6A7Y942_9HYPH|nr:class I SAM-dependent methyltransferase [Segnochrobactrum spirostomi]MQT14162.1 class I SAM-dependent methyltransferase [Segnochrobactrum spirostomi]